VQHHNDLSKLIYKIKVEGKQINGPTGTSVKIVKNIELATFYRYIFLPIWVHFQLYI
jgi:phenolic acid decarboxylase